MRKAVRTQDSPLLCGTAIAVFREYEESNHREVRAMQKASRNRKELERWLGREPGRENAALAIVVAGSLALLALFLSSLLQGM